MERLLGDARRALRQSDEAGRLARSPLAGPLPIRRHQERAPFVDREGPEAEPAPAGAREEQPAARPPVPVAAPARGLAGMLSSRAALRRALVLSEIIGPPRALRPPDNPER